MMSIFKRKPKTVPVIPEEKLSFFQHWVTKLESTSKQLMWFITFNAIIWVYLSYLLAWFGKEQIAESLSTTVCSTILGAMITYLTTSTIQNISKYNPKVGGTPIDCSTNYEEPLDLGDDPVNTEGPDAEFTDELEEEVVG